MQFEDDVVGGVTLVRPAIQSPDYVPGVSGWAIKIDGSVEFNDGEFRGTLHVGDSADYVEVGLDPNPKILLGTSHPDATAPGFLGYPFAASPQLRLASPMTAANGPGILALAPASAVLLGDLQVVLQANNGPIQLAGGTGIEMSGPAYRLDGTDQGRGIKNYTATTTSTGAAIAEQVHITSGNVEFVQGRVYKISYHYQGQGTTAGDGIGFRLRRSTVGGNSLFDSLATHDVRAVNSIVNGETAQVVTPAATITTVVVGTVYRQSGAGNVLGFANAANPAWIMIEDIGATVDYPGAKLL
jgi:hypothetical protein